ncbi:hypothetical protein HELRODRAFT_159037 [Helobdella robusta]|uniref:Uncharacterized protein n=1 Tax=Helobdella robusta TaxID=6412 RepID=T1ENI3_HELRO|nr:hypothetical protein HELRODRAFT_159037 [Helobdella robusta]ESO12491.1 hypothetical protein HELRODRAFT_159037 [Helobdella robusta]
MSVFQEEEFLENEVIEVKNKKTLSNSDNDYCSFGQLRNGSKSKPLSFYSYQVLSDYGSPSLDHNNLKKQSFFHGPSSHSLTHDWLMNSCVETCRPEDGAQTEDDTKNAGCLVDDQVLPALSTGDDNFDEPTWMKYVTDEVNKQSINMPLTTATLEIVSDSLNGSSENISAIQSNEDSIETPARNISLDHFSTPHRAANQLNYLQDISKASFSTPPSETKTSSTSYQNSTLLSKDSVPSHLTSISAKTLSSPSLPEPSAPSSATIIRSGVSLLPLKVNIFSSISSHPSNALLTPSSERCLEVCYLNPPPKVLKKKLSDSEDNISFSSSRSSATYRQSLSTPSTIPSSTPQYLYCDHNISSSVDHLFAYHDGIARKQYCVVDSTHQTNHARICELPVKNLSEDKSSCSACGFCIGERLFFKYSDISLLLFFFLLIF